MHEDNKWKYSSVVISGDKDNRTFLVNTPKSIKHRNRIHLLKSPVSQSNFALDTNTAHSTSAVEPCSEFGLTTTIELLSELSGTCYVNPSVRKMTCITTRSSACAKVPKPIGYRDTELH